MPDPTNPFPPGTPEHERYEQLMAAQAGAQQTSNRNAGPPPGAQKNSETRYTEVGAGPNGSNVVWEKQADGSWNSRYTSVGSPSTSSGGGTTNYRTANETRDALLARGGVPVGANTIYVRNGSSLDKYSLDSDGSYRPFGIVTNRTELGLYAQAVASGQTPAGGARPTGQPPVGQPTGQPQSEAPLIIDPLRPSQAPTFGSRAFQGAVTPGAQQSQTGTRTYSLGNALDRINVANPGQGFSGYINPYPGTTAPAGIGTGPGTQANRIDFPGGIGRGYTSPANPFGSVNYTLPDWVNNTVNTPGPLSQAGFNDKGFFEPVSIGYNVTNANIDPLAGPVTQGGMGSLLLAGPQTVHGMNGTPGFNPNAVAASNIGLAAGRDFSGMSPAGQAVATAALLDRIMQGQEREEESLGAGNGVGWMNFARGGRVGTRPLGGQPDLITNEPIFLVGASGKIHGLMGEDNADLDMRPNREAVYFKGRNNSMMDIVPLEPPRRFDEGGTVSIGTALGWMAEDEIARLAEEERLDALEAQRSTERGITTPYGQLLSNDPALFTDGRAPLPGYGFAPPSPYASPAFIPWDYGETFGGPLPRGIQTFAEGGNVGIGDSGTQPPPVPAPSPTAPYVPPPLLEGQPPAPEGGTQPGGDLPPPPPSTEAPPDAGTPPAAPPPLQFPVWQGVIPPQVGAPVAPLDPLGPDLAAIRAPWQQAQQELAQLEYRRRTIDDPRRAAAGLGASVGIATEGDVPQTQLPPGMFYDPSGQVSRMINEIEGAASTLTAAGPGETATDLEAINNRATYVGQALDDMAKIRQLEDARVSVEAGGNVPNLQVGNLMASYLQSQINELSSQLVGPSSPLYNSPANQALQQQIAQMQAQMNQLNALNSGQLQQADTAGQLQVLNAQIAWLQSRLPPGMSEADLTTELAGLRNRVAQQDKRVQATQAVLNLAKVGVPAIGAARQTLDPLAA